MIPYEKAVRELAAYFREAGDKRGWRRLKESARRFLEEEERQEQDDMRKGWCEI